MSNHITKISGLVGQVKGHIRNHVERRKQGDSPVKADQIDRTDSLKDGIASGQQRAAIDSRDLVDITIQFVGARDLPRMDAVGGADPYFRATLDDEIKYTSSTLPSTLNPEWHELWHIKNVPKSAELKIKVYDKDEGAVNDDYIGDCKTIVGASCSLELVIKSRMTKKDHGIFQLNVIANPCRDNTLPLYSFAGPCRYVRHKSPTVGALTVRSTEERLYSTWKIYIVGIHEFFGDTWQGWNKEYPAAQSIFRPLSPLKPLIQNAHRLLYARSTANGFGVLHRAEDFINVFRDEARDNKIRPAVYTYVVDEDTFRFSETGAAFFVDFASKHALASKCAERVRYSGEFHWRPSIPGGWAAFHEDETMSESSVPWEIVLDNNSGTYAPDKNMLPALRSLIEYNFPGLRVVTLDRQDPQRKESVDACLAYGKQHRGIQDWEVHPTLRPDNGSKSLMHMASVHVPGVTARTKS